MIYRKDINAHASQFVQEIYRLRFGANEQPNLFRCNPWHMYVTRHFYFSPLDAFSQPEAQLALAGVVEVTLACLSLVIFGRRLLEKPRGSMVFRGIFIPHCMLYAVSLSGAIRWLIIATNSSPYSVSASCILLLGCTFALATFSFDIVAVAGFMFCSLAPVMYTSIFEVEGARGITIVYIGGAFFFSILAWALHSAEVDILHNQEIIARQTHELGDMNAELSDSLKLHDETLNSIDEIILNIGLDGVIFGNTVARSAQILGAEPNSRNFVDVLGYEGDAAVGAQAWFEMIAADEIDFETLAENGPKSMRISGTDEKVFRIKYFAKRKEGRLKAVIMTLSDVTRETHNRKAADEAILRANFVLTAQENPAGLGRFLHDSQIFFNELAQGNLVHDYKLKLHTMKGTAAMYFIVEVAAAIDALEMGLKVDSANLRESAAEILAGIETWKRAQGKTLARIGVLDSEKTILAKSHLDLLKLHFAEAPLGVMTFDTVLKRLLAPNLNQIVVGFERVVARVAQRKDKMVKYVFTDFDAHYLLTNERIVEAVDAMVHLFSNSVDHGLELPATRLARRKPELGKIEVRLRCEQENLLVQVEDDGGGIDPVKLSFALNERGVDTSGWNEQRLIRSVLQAGVSTAEQANDISGQGVGLSALDTKVTALGGRIEIFTELGRGTCFEIRLPLSAGILRLETNHLQKIG